MNLNDLLSMPLGIMLMMALTVMPIKIAADLFGAENNQIKHCAIAVALEVAAAILLIAVVGGFSAVMLIFVAASAIYWIVLKISFSCSFVFTIFVCIIQLGMLQLLAKLPALILG